MSTKMDKTAVVEVISSVTSPAVQARPCSTRKKYFAHDEENDLNEGDRVRIIETRPLSAKKRWRVLEVLERAR